MKGRRSCVSWYHYQDFRARFLARRLLRTGCSLPTDRASPARWCGAAALGHLPDRQHLGSAVARKASQVLLFDPRARVTRLSPTHRFPRPCGTARAPALLLMEQNLARPIGRGRSRRRAWQFGAALERLCRKHAGTGPASLYRQLRMRYANWLIVNTDRSVTDIANEAGFCGLRALLAPVQGRLRSFALDAPAATATTDKRRRRRGTRVRLRRPRLHIRS